MDIEKAEKTKKRKPQENTIARLYAILKVLDKLPYLYAFLVFLFTFALITVAMTSYSQVIHWIVLFTAISYVPVIVFRLKDGED